MARKTNTTITKLPTSDSINENHTTIVGKQNNSEITNDSMIECISGVSGLFYKSNLTPGYIVEWNSIGDIQYLPYRELISIRSSQRRFFEDNWIFIPDEEVLKKLGIERYYVNSIKSGNIEDVFSMKPEKIREFVPKLPNGTKESIATCAKQKIRSGELDSLGVLKALEETLNVELTDKI